MNNKKTQEQWVLEQLNKNGEVSRNGALQNFISRLGAIICNLNKEGWNITGDYRKTEHGKDFIYTVVSKPYKKTMTFKEVNGERIAIYA